MKKLTFDVNQCKPKTPKKDVERKNAEMRPFKNAQEILEGKKQIIVTLPKEK